MGNSPPYPYHDFKCGEEINILINKCANNIDYKKNYDKLLKLAIEIYTDKIKPLQLKHYLDYYENGLIDHLCADIYILYRESDIFYNAAIKSYEDIIYTRNNTWAMISFAQYYIDGINIARDYGKAMELLLRASNLGNSDAFVHISLMYKKGYGVEIDYKKSIEYLLEASMLKNSDAMKILGDIYFEGEYVEQDYKIAMEWYMKGVELDNPKCMYNAGTIYHRIDKDYKKALELYNKAIEFGSVDAIHSKALLLEDTWELMDALKFYIKISLSSDYEVKKIDWNSKLKSFTDKYHIILCPLLVKESDELCLLENEHNILKRKCDILREKEIEKQKILLNMPKKYEQHTIIAVHC